MAMEMVFETNLVLGEIAGESFSATILLLKG